MDDLPLDDETRALLHQYGFEAETFRGLRARLRDGRASAESNRVRGTIEPPAPNDVTALPERGSRAREELDAIGRQAIRDGRVGAVILAGGMATRFGGVVKAAVPAIDEHTFLDLKLRDLRSAAAGAGGTVPAYLMTSFATHEEVSRLGAAASTASVPVQAFAQFISLRLSPDAGLFLEDDGSPSAYAPGHGDLPAALARAGILERFTESGGRYLYMSNVDNLGATLDPAVIGFHVRSGAEVTAEVVHKEPGDRGGAPARVDGTLQIVESFRFPPDFDQDRIDVFNTNSFVLDAECLKREIPFTWFAVNKTVEGRPAVQFERLVGEITSFLKTACLVVERGGADGRFQPVKDPEELEQRRGAIRELLVARGVL
ncbi:MAG: UTP--glucose-1-phosphate uridylyltransferase [Sandaracinaceae bacterium]